MSDWGLKATLLLAALGAGGCAGGGGLELEGPAAEQIFQRYSGTWELDVGRSDDAAQKLASATRAQGNPGGSGAGGRGAGRGGGGGGGGFPGGGGGGDFRGGGGGRGGPGGARPSLEAMEMGRDLAGNVATTLELRLDSALVRITPSGGAGYELDTDGDVSELELLDGSVVERRVFWEEDLLMIRREIAGFLVTDRYMVAADGEEMIVRRTIEHPRGSDVEARLVYARAAQ